VSAFPWTDCPVSTGLGVRIQWNTHPKAKRPEFFSLATPIKVEGGFKDFAIGINKLRLVTSLASFVTSPLHVPVRRLFVGTQPENDVEVCRVAWANRNVVKAAVTGKGD